ncbi:MAG: flavodoxin domain-containing protein [Dehalococcoidales bacterium]|nr:flavodoxin domain-containing protein [Dehalococcoidales bacterium]
MAKVIVVYDSLFGNTRQVGETIVEGMKETTNIDALVTKTKGVDLKKLGDYDLILIGSPNHVGGSTLGIRNFIGKLGKLNLKGKWVAVFDTYAGTAHEQAVKKMEKWLSEKAPALKIATTGLSVKVEGMRGPISDGELPKCRVFGANIAKQLKILA